MGAKGQETVAETGRRLQREFARGPDQDCRFAVLEGDGIFRDLISEERASIGIGEPIGPPDGMERLSRRIDLVNEPGWSIVFP